MNGQKKVQKNRHGMSISDAEVDALIVVFRTLDRGGDPQIPMRSAALRKFRGTLQRIKDRTRGQRPAPAEDPPAEDPPAEDFPDVDGSDGRPSLADRVLGMFDLEEDG